MPCAIFKRFTSRRRSGTATTPPKIPSSFPAGYVIGHALFFGRRCALDKTFSTASFTLQVIGQTGGRQPRVLRDGKMDHVAITLAGPAKGPMMKFLFSFSGVENTKDMCKGAPNSMWQRTPDGWADATTWVIFAHELVVEKKRRGLENILLFVDNAAAHLSLEVIRLFIDNDIQLFGLIPAGRGYHQPLDVGYGGRRRGLGT